MCNSCPCDTSDFTNLKTRPLSSFTMSKEDFLDLLKITDHEEDD